MGLGVPLLDGGGGEAGPLLDGLEALGGPRLTPPRLLGGPYRTPEDGVPGGLPEYIVVPCRPRDRDRVVMPDDDCVRGAVALPLSPGDFPDIYNVLQLQIICKILYDSGLKNCSTRVHLQSRSLLEKGIPNVLE